MMNFANSSFLPISWTVAPNNCAGDQTASLNVPCNSPNGAVAVEWYLATQLDMSYADHILCRHCTGYKVSSCTMLNITGGNSDYAELMIELGDNKPVVACQNTSSFQETVVASWPPVTSSTEIASSSCTSA